MILSIFFLINLKRSSMAAAAALNSLSLLRRSLSFSIPSSTSFTGNLSFLITPSSTLSLISPPQPSLSRYHTLTRTICHASSTNDEEAAAKAAAATRDTGTPTMFVWKALIQFHHEMHPKLSSAIQVHYVEHNTHPKNENIVYEDENILAFRDINPQAPTHILVIPKIRGGLTELGKLVAEKEGIIDGFRVVINSGTTACQSVFHLHLHVLGGRQMKWPPG
ncbi:14 kDa zinc-binding protein-like protein [Drosera capensis]